MRYLEDTIGDVIPDLEIPRGTPVVYELNADLKTIADKFSQRLMAIPRAMLSRRFGSSARGTSFGRPCLVFHAHLSRVVPGLHRRHIMRATIVLRCCLTNQFDWLVGQTNQFL